MKLLLRAAALGLVLACPAAANAQAASLPRLHHVGLNSVDPDNAITWYLKLWPSARRTTFAGYPAVESDIYLLFNKVDRAPAGAWRDDLHRAESQSAFWHIGASTNSTTTRDRLAPLGITHLPLFIYPNDTIHTVWRSGLAPYAGTLTASQLPSGPNAPPREGGFSYVVAPDGVLFELTGGPDTHDALSHVHFYHEQPLCAANWYAQHLGFELPRPTPEPCDVKYGEATWPALEPAGTIRQPQGTVRFANGSMSWYPRQCVASRCGRDRRLVSSRGQVLDHVAFSVENFDALYATLNRDGVKILESPHAFGDTRAFMIEDPDGLAIEIVDATRPR